MKTQVLLIIILLALTGHAATTSVSRVGPHSVSSSYLGTTLINSQSNGIKSVSHKEDTLSDTEAESTKVEPVTSMELAFFISETVIVLIVVPSYLIIRIVRGKGVLRTILVGWGLLILIFVTLCLLLPILVSIFSNDLANEMQQKWLPEPTAVAGAVIMGWAPAAVFVSIGVVIKILLNVCCPALSRRIEGHK